MKKQLALSFVIAIVIIMILLSIFYKPSIKNVTDAELDDINGVKVTFVDGTVFYGPIATRILDYIDKNPNCSVEDLRIIKGVDDMIIDQLKERFR